MKKEIELHPLQTAKGAALLHMLGMELHPEQAAKQADLLRMLGLLYQGQGDYDSALPYLQEALDI